MHRENRQENGFRRSYEKTAYDSQFSYPQHTQRSLHSEVKNSAMTVFDWAFAQNIVIADHHTKKSSDQSSKQTTEQIAEQFIEQLIEQFAEQSPQQTPEKNPHHYSPQVSLWDSTPFFTSIPKEYGLEQSRTELELSITTFFDEYALLNPRKKYANYGARGWKNQNSVPTKVACERFVESLTQQHKDVQRASLEVWAANTFEQFLADDSIPQNSLLVMVSPRGSIEEGYPGEDPANYFFINVYVKQNSTFATLHQFTSYALMPQLLDQHNAIVTKTNAHTATANFLQTLPAAFSKNQQEIPDSHWVITHPILILPQTSHSTANHTIADHTLSLIENELYAHQDTWAVCIADLPEIDFDLYTNQAQALTQELLLIFDELMQTDELSQAQAQAQSQAPSQKTAHTKTEITRKTKKTQESITTFNELISLSRRFLLKWVEQHAKNYSHLYTEQEKEAFPSIVSFIAEWKNKTYGATTATTTSKTTNSSAYPTAYSTAYASTYAAPHSSAKSTNFSAQFSLSSSKLSSVSSASHCVVGTPGSAAEQAQTSIQTTQSGKNSQEMKKHTDSAIQAKLKKNQDKLRSKKAAHDITRLSHQNLAHNQNLAHTDRMPHLPNHTNSIEHYERHQRIQTLQKKRSQILEIQEQVLPLFIENLQTQQFEVIYIWFLDPSLVDQYEPGCYRKTTGGVVLGPCHVDLEQDELLAQIPFPEFDFSSSWSRPQSKNRSSTSKRFLEESEYLTLHQQLFEIELQLSFETALAEQQDSTTSTSFNPSEQKNNTKTDSLTPEEQERQQKIVSLLSRKIFRVTFSDLVAGFAGTPLVSYTTELLSIPKKCAEFLAKSGPNKIKAVRELITILEKNEISAILQALQVTDFEDTSTPYLQ